MLAIVRPRRKIERVATALLLSASIAITAGTDARAGSAQDPEIVDPCPEVHPDQLVPYADVCAAWFETQWDPVFEEGNVVGWEFSALRTTLELGGAVDARPTSTWAYQLSWGMGACRHSWYIRDTLNAGPVPTLGESCPGETSHHWEIPAETVVTSGNRITVTLPRSVLDTLTGSYQAGTELSQPAAHVQMTLEPRGVVQVAQDWEEAGPGRTFVVGQDRPPIP